MPDFARFARFWLDFARFARFWLDSCREYFCDNCWVHGATQAPCACHQSGRRRQGNGTEGITMGLYSGNTPGLYSYTNLLKKPWHHRTPPPPVLLLIAHGHYFHNTCARLVLPHVRCWLLPPLLIILIAIPMIAIPKAVILLLPQDCYAMRTPRGRHRFVQSRFCVHGDGTTFRTFKPEVARWLLLPVPFLQAEKHSVKPLSPNPLGLQSLCNV